MIYQTRYKSHHDASRDLKEHCMISTSKQDYLSNLLNNPATGKRVIYIHVPFCNKICSFCPFHRPDKLARRNYHDYLITQIDEIANYEYMKAEIDSIYFGGGTPTSLSPFQLDLILKKLRASFNISKTAEISIETSASELTNQMLDVLVNNGVNRLSIGIQTFNDTTRKMLNRRGSGEFAYERVKNAVSRIKNTSIDLIYNYPNQTISDLSEDLNKIVSLGLAGISFYSLMLHEKTPLYNNLTQQQKELMQDTTHEYQLFTTIINTLSKHGYKIYELTKMIRDNIDQYQYITIRHNQGSCIALGHGSGGNLDITYIITQ